MEKESEKNKEENSEKNEETKEDEESELEEQLEKQKVLSQEEIKNLIQLNENSPSLEQLNQAPQKRANLEQSLEDVSTNKKDSDKNEFEYLPKQQQEEEKKYIQYETGHETPKTTPLENLGKNQEITSIEFSPMYQANENIHQEKINPVKRRDISELGKEKPFETKQVEYKKYENH